MKRYICILLASAASLVYPSVSIGMNDSEARPAEVVIDDVTRSRLLAYVNEASSRSGGLAKLVSNARKGEGDAALPLAVLNLVGAAGYTDGAEAITLLHQALDGSKDVSAQAAWILSQLYSGKLRVRLPNGGWWEPPLGENRHDELILRAAEQGSQHARVELARQYLTGDGRQPDLEIGLFMLSQVIQSRADNVGSKVAEVGDLIWSDREHPVDVAYRLKDSALGTPAATIDISALRQQAMEGSPAAMTTLALQHLPGGVLGLNRERALQMLQVAAGTGYAPALDQLTSLRHQIITDSGG